MASKDVSSIMQFYLDLIEAESLGDYERALKISNKSKLATLIFSPNIYACSDTSISKRRVCLQVQTCILDSTGEDQ